MSTTSDQQTKKLAQQLQPTPATAQTNQTIAKIKEMVVHNNYSSQI